MVKPKKCQIKAEGNEHVHNVAKKETQKKYILKINTLIIGLSMEDK